MRWVAVLLVMGATLLPEPGNAEPGCRTVTQRSPYGHRYEVEVCDGSGVISTPAASGSGSGRGGRRYQPSELVRVASSVDGVQCSIWATRTSMQGRQAVASQHDFGVVGNIFDTSVWEVWQHMVATMPACGAGATTNPPEQAAFAFLYTYDTPDPEPWIAPGFAITGKRAYLETRGPLTHTPAPVETPLGRLEVAFAATSFTVDWGDDTPAEEYTSPGRPWPDGEASHVYTHIGAYEVVVAQRWQATWRLGDQTGEVILTGAPSVIEALEVDQLQAVRDR